MATEEKLTKETNVIDKSVPTVQSPRTWWIIGGTLAGLAGIALIVGVVWGVTHRGAMMNARFDDDQYGPRITDNRGFDRGGMGREGMMMGGQGSTDSSTRVFGVVTAVDGSTLTVAGNGTTKKVVINDSTQYYGAAQPVKVNDSVTITGATSGDTFTAGRIVIQRQ